MRLGPPPAEPEVPGQFWIDFIRDTAPVFRKSTLEQLGEFIPPTWQALIDGAKYVDPRLEEIIGELEPDVDRRGQRRRRSPRSWPAGGRGSGSCPATRRSSRIRLVAPFSSGYAAADRSRLAGLPGRVPPDPRRLVDGLRRLLPRARRAAAWATATARARVHARVPVPQPLLLSRRGGLPRGCAARPDVAPAGLDGPGGRRRLGAARATWRARRGPDLPLARAASGRRTSG